MSEREELAKALRRAYYAGYYGDEREPLTGIYDDMSERDKRAYLAEADVALARCARVPAEVWGVCERLLNADHPDRRAAGRELEAALKSVPRPAEPAPRALPTLKDLEHGWYSTQGEQKPWQWAYEVLREHAAPAAARALPTRDEVSRGLRAAYHGRPVTPEPTGPGFLDEADYVLSLLREHASPADEALRAELAEAQEDCSSWERACKAAEARAAEAERERDEARNELENCKLRNQQLRKTEATLLCLEKDYCIEGDYAPDGPGDTRHPVTRRIEAMQAMHTADVEKLKDQLDEAQERAAAYRESSEAAHAKHAAAAQLANDNCDKLYKAYDEIRDLKAQVIRAGEACAEASAQLAARPEPVVIDEALASAMCDAFWDGPRNTGYTGTDERDMLAALRSVFGEQVSVAGLRTDDQRAYELLSDECGVLRGECREYRAEIDKLRAELQAAQRDFESCKGSLACALKANEEGTAALSTLRKQHEALRAAAERVAGLYSNAQEVIALRALLKPATTEAQAPAPRWEDQPSATNDFQTLRAEFKERLKTKEPEQWVNASPADALRPNDRHAQRPVTPETLSPEERARVERIEAALRCFLSAWDWGRDRGDVYLGEEAQKALAMLDAGKQEVGNG